MAMKISLSFKETEKSMYEFLQKQLSASIYLKQLIKNEMEQEKPEKTKRDIFNF
jgi:hypothetical protein